MPPKKPKAAEDNGTEGVTVPTKTRKRKVKTEPADDKSPKRAKKIIEINLDEDLNADDLVSEDEGQNGSEGDEATAVVAGDSEAVRAQRQQRFDERALKGKKADEELKKANKYIEENAKEMEQYLQIGDPDEPGIPENVRLRRKTLRKRYSSAEMIATLKLGQKYWDFTKDPDAKVCPSVSVSTRYAGVLTC